MTTELKAITNEQLEKARTARFLLPEPGPEVVGQFILRDDEKKEHIGNLEGVIQKMISKAWTSLPIGADEFFGEEIWEELKRLGVVERE